MRAKNYKVLRALMEVPYHPKLIALVLWFCHRNNDPVITSAYRKGRVHPKDSGIHMTIPCRAVDMRSRNLKHPEAVRDDINQHWAYDPTRPNLKCCVYHNTGRGWHFHLQVHDRTEYIEHPEEA